MHSLGTPSSNKRLKANENGTSGCAVCREGVLPKFCTNLGLACVDVIPGFGPERPTGLYDVVADIATPYPVPLICRNCSAPREDFAPSAASPAPHSQRAA